MKSLGPPNTFHLSAATGWLELGNCAEANEELKRLGPEVRGHPDVLEVRLQIYAATGNWDQAAEVGRALVQMRPEDRQGWITQAYAVRRMKGGGIPQAREVLTKAQALFPQEPLIAYNLACYECQLGDLPAARRWLAIAFNLGNAKMVKRMALQDEDLEALWGEIEGG